MLANIYIHRLLRAWQKLGLESKLQARIINYADDLVIVCRDGADEALSWLRWIVERIGLRLNEAKTCVRAARQEAFDFLGYTFGRCYSEQNGQAYLGTWPSKKSIRRLQKMIHQQTARRMTLLEAEMVVERLNRMLRGWANYFCSGPVSKTYRSIDRYTAYRLRRWLRCKHKVRNRPWAFPYTFLYGELKLLPLCTLTPSLPWANV